MPEEQVEICYRLKQVRQALNFTRVAFAKQIGIDSGFLSNIEYARAPVRYGLGNAVCRKFNVNQRWLALGKRPCFAHVQIGSANESGLKESALFSEVYAKSLARDVDKTIRQMSELLRCKEDELDDMLPGAGLGHLNYSFYTAILSMISGDLGKMVNSMPLPLQKKLFAAMSDCFHDFLKAHVKEITKPIVAAEAMKKWR